VRGQRSRKRLKNSLCTDGLELLESSHVIGYVPRDVLEIVIELFLRSLVLVPGVDLQRNHDTGDDKEYFPEAIPQVLPEFPIHE
jgi:hypothetical protein